MARGRGGEPAELPEGVAHVVDLLYRWAPVSVRRMFSGVGLFRGGVIFALVLRDTVHFRVDDGNRADYEAAGMEPFSYSRSGRTVSIAYYEVPPDILDEGEDLTRWAMKAYEAALRTSVRKRPKRKRSR